MGRPGITWRRGRDSNPRGSSPGCFQDSCLKPLGHLSGEIVRPQSSQRQSQASTGNNSDLGVFLSSMPVNWKGRVAIRDLSRRSRGDFQPIDAPNPRAGRPHPLALRSLRPGPLLLARRRGIFVVGDTPTSPVKGEALATLSWLSPIRRPCLWWTLIGALLCPYGAGTPKSEHLPRPRSVPSTHVRGAFVLQIRLFFGCRSTSHFAGGFVLQKQGCRELSFYPAA